MIGTTWNEKCTAPEDLLAVPLTWNQPAAGATWKSSRLAPSSSIPLIRRACTSSSSRWVATAFTTPATSWLRAKSCKASTFPTIVSSSFSTFRP